MRCARPRVAGLRPPVALFPQQDCAPSRGGAPRGHCVTRWAFLHWVAANVDVPMAPRVASVGIVYCT
eukprot:11174329-Lingulodinium_polyedra.AAC.1